MIWVACLVELLIQDWVDFGILFALQLINASVSFYEAAKAGDAVAALKAALKPVACAKRDGKWTNINAGELVPGDLVMLSSGAAVPADCVVNAGAIDVDQAALTGESLPVGMVAGDRPKSAPLRERSVKLSIPRPLTRLRPPAVGSTVSRGEVEATVEFTGARTFFGRTAAMIQSVEQLSNIQKVLLRIMVFLLVISFVLCGVCLAYLLVRGRVAGRDLKPSHVSRLTIPSAESRSCTPSRTWWCCSWRPSPSRWRRAPLRFAPLLLNPILMSLPPKGGHHHHHGAGLPRALQARRHRVAPRSHRGARRQCVSHLCAADSPIAF